MTICIESPTMMIMPDSLLELYTIMMEFEEKYPGLMDICEWCDTTSKHCDVCLEAFKKE